MATFFGYRGFVGCHGFKDNLDPDSLPEGLPLKREHLSDALFNNPFDQENPEYILDLTKCHFNQEAINVLKSIKRTDDDEGEIDVFNHADLKVISWVGQVLKLINSESKAPKSYDVSVLDSIVPEELEIPDGLKEFIDFVLDGESEGEK